MKTFTLGLLATTVLGIKIQGQNQMAQSNVSESIDLINNEVDDQGYTVAPGQTLEFILKENPTTGFEWKYDETIIDDLYQVESIYKQDVECDGGMSGCGGTKYFKVTAGLEEGVGIFYTCKARSWEEPLRYDVMLPGAECEEITINIQKAKVKTNDFTSNLAQVHEIGNLRTSIIRYNCLEIRPELKPWEDLRTPCRVWYTSGEDKINLKKLRRGKEPYKNLKACKNNEFEGTFCYHELERDEAQSEIYPNSLYGGANNFYPWSAVKYLQVGQTLTVTVKVDEIMGYDFEHPTMVDGRYLSLTDMEYLGNFGENQMQENQNYYVYTYTVVQVDEEDSTLEPDVPIDAVSNAAVTVLSTCSIILVSLAFLLQ